MAGNNPRRRLRWHFANSACHTSHPVADAMRGLCWKRISRPAYSPDLAIGDFDLFRHMKEPLPGVAVVDAEELKSEVMPFLARAPEDEKSRAFEH
jgi:hypothetical protein